MRALAALGPWGQAGTRGNALKKSREARSPWGGRAERRGGARVGVAVLLSDPLPVPRSLRREGYTVQVNVNDYLDIYCPHYNSSGPGGGAEQYVLYMVSRAGYRTCNASQGFKRWECNRPRAPHSPIKFSEKFQRYSAFSLGYEFHAGHEYYYICEWPPGGAPGRGRAGAGPGTLLPGVGTGHLGVSAQTGQETMRGLATVRSSGRRVTVSVPDTLGAAPQGSGFLKGRDQRG